MAKKKDEGERMKDEKERMKDEGERMKDELPDLSGEEIKKGDEISSIVHRPSSKKEKKYYERASWKGVKEVFKCETCGTCRDDEDSMIEHVLLHVAKDKQEEVFDSLVERRDSSLRSE